MPSDPRVSVKITTKPDSQVERLEVSSGGRGPFPADRKDADPYNGTPFWWRIHEIPATGEEPSIELEFICNPDTGSIGATILQEIGETSHLISMEAPQIVALAEVLAQHVVDGKLVTPPMEEPK